MIARVVARENFALVRANDSVADTQSETRSLAYFLGGKERIENTIEIGDSRSIVAKCTISTCPLPDDVTISIPPGVGGFLDGIVGIIQNVQEHLLQLVTVGDHERQVLVIALDQFDFAA